MIQVTADATLLRYLIEIQAIDVLPGLFGRIITPPAVIQTRRRKPPVPAGLDAHDSPPRGQVSLLPLTNATVQGMVKARIFHPPGHHTEFAHWYTQPEEG
jgi:hypothetical protein